MPHIRVSRAGVEVGAPQVAALYPEVLESAKGCAVELFERAVRGDEHIPLDDSESIVIGKLRLDVLVEEHLVEHDGGAFRVDVLLSVW